MANLSERALLTRFSAPAWSGEKLDRLATQSNTVDKGAPSDAQKSISRLVPKHLLVKIRRVVQDARQVWYSLSLPWADKGERIMDSMAFEIMNKRDPAVTEAIDQLRGLADYDLEALKDGVRLKKGKRDGDDTGRELANIHARAVVDDIDRKMAGVFGAPAPASTPSSNLQPAA
jgi:hypothetical protein